MATKKIPTNQKIERDIYIVECEKCGTQVGETYNPKTRSIIKGSWVRGAIQTGPSYKYNGGVGMYCKLHVPNY